jgi:hypothetical protein
MTKATKLQTQYTEVANVIQTAIDISVCNEALNVFIICVIGIVILH